MATISNYAIIANGDVRFHLQFNASTGRVTSVDCENLTTQQAYGEVTTPAGQTLGRLFAAGQVSTQVVPNGALRARVVEDQEFPGEYYAEVFNQATGQWETPRTRFQWPAVDVPQAAAIKTT